MVWEQALSSQELCGFLTVCLALLGALFLEGLVLSSHQAALMNW